MPLVTAKGKPVDPADLLGDAQIRQLIENGRQISAVYGNSAPAKPVTGQNWETYALACLARAHYTLMTILDNPTREVDCATLARSLYEHVVTFAWVMIDLREHFPMLLRWEYDERKKMVSDPHGFTIIDPPHDGLIRRSFVEMGKIPAPATPDRALEADRYWSRCNINWNWHFRHGYAGLFRPLSVYVHPTIAGLDAFVERHPAGPTVGVPLPRYGALVAVDAVQSFADALAVASHRFGWPELVQLVLAFTHGIKEPEGSGSDG